jgi:hypothetical protein
MKPFPTSSYALFGAALLLTIPTAEAALPLYGTPGVENIEVYSFTASGNGPVTAYFAGSSAGYGSKVGLSINGGPVSLWGLQNNTTPLGTAVVLGNVSLGDTMTFVLSVATGDSGGPSDPTMPSYFLYSDKALNPEGSQHIHAAAYAGGDYGIPAGTYVGFEDISPIGGGDRDYNDNQFVFTGPGLNRVPEGGSAVAMLGLAMAGLGVARRYLKK